MTGSRLGRRARRALSQSILQVLAIVVTIVCVGPIAAIVIASLHDVRTFSDLSLSLGNLSFASYARMLEAGELPIWVMNTVIVSIGTTVLVVLLDVIAAFAFAKIDFRGRRWLFALLLSTMMLPFSVTLIPTYLIAVNLGLNDSYAGIILPAVAGPLGVFLLRQFIQEIPDELLESARIDGASTIRIFRSIILPLSFQPMIIVAILTFVAAWNSFIWPLLIIQSDSLKTLTVGLATTNTQFTQDLGNMTASTVVSLIPTTILFLALQKYFLRGVTAGAVKG
ncbi:carbohydrate ABC transporter permease [Microbacterium sp. 2MCAF23]|uniref:carbohydrate ABC transporter permease n=1 Tax=Microbacterium sp. 2MCAF23 TaxID=3232985 RepID=UPI003F9C5867